LTQLILQIKIKKAIGSNVCRVHFEDVEKSLILQHLQDFLTLFFYKIVTDKNWIVTFFEKQKGE
jgi:hypothetical protein